MTYWIFCNRIKDLPEKAEFLDGSSEDLVEIFDALSKNDVTTALELALDGASVEVKSLCCNDDPLFDPVVVLTARIVIDALDGVFNIIADSIASLKSDEANGAYVRMMFDEIEGFKVPADIDNATLGRLFKVRKRDRELVVEPVGDWKSEVFDRTIALVDVIGLLSPSTGGGAFLAVKGGGKITAVGLSNFLKQVTKHGEATTTKMLEVLRTTKGSRPDPDTYLDAEYITKHLAKFDEGASRIVSKDTYLKRGVGKPDAGKTEFVAPKGEIDEILQLPIEQQAERLGIPVDQISNGELVRIDFPGNKVEMPSGNEWGANDEWIPGGVTSGGANEAIVKTEGVNYIVKNL